MIGLEIGTALHSYAMTKKRMGPLLIHFPGINF